MLMKLGSVIAGTSGFGASIAASLPTDASVYEAIGKWPLTIVLGIVCCFCVWLNYKQGVAFQSAAVKQADAHRVAAELLAKSNTDAVTKLLKAQAEMIERLSGNYTKMSDLLMQRPCIRERIND